MATAHKFTLTNERVLDGDRFGLRQVLAAQEPAGLVPNGHVLAFDSLGGGLTADIFRGVASLAQVTPGAALVSNPCDYVVFASGHGLTTANLTAPHSVSLRFKRHPSTLTPLPVAWVALEDLQQGTTVPTVERTVTAVPSSTELQVAVPFWTPQAGVYCEVLLDGTVAASGTVSARRRITAAGTYRADRVYRAFDSVADATNAALLVQAELEVLLAGLVVDGTEYMRGTNPETVYVTV